MVCAHIGTPNATKRCKSYLLFESKIDMLEGVLMVPDRCQPIRAEVFDILIVCFLQGIVLPQYCVHERIYFHEKPTNIWSTCWTKSGPPARDSSCKERFTSGSPVAPKCNVILVVTSQHRLRVPLKPLFNGRAVSFRESRSKILVNC